MAGFTLGSNNPKTSKEYSTDHCTHSEKGQRLSGQGKCTRYPLSPAGISILCHVAVCPQEVDRYELHPWSHLCPSSVNEEPWQKVRRQGEQCGRYMFSLDFLPVWWLQTGWIPKACDMSAFGRASLLFFQRQECQRDHGTSAKLSTKQKNRLPGDVQPSSLIPRPLQDVFFSLPTGKKCNSRVPPFTVTNSAPSYMPEMEQSRECLLLSLKIKDLISFDLGSHSSCLWVPDKFCPTLSLENDTGCITCIEGLELLHRFPFKDITNLEPLQGNDILLFLVNFHRLVQGSLQLVD